MTVGRAPGANLVSRLRPGLLLAAILLAVGTASPVAGLQTDGEVTWRNAAELSFLLSGGNSGASTLGIRNTLRRTQPDGEWRLQVSALRTDATRTSRYAEGSGPEDFELREERERDRTAERYSIQNRYDRNLSERFFASGSASWDRNTFAGFTGRTVLSAGVGSQWGSDAEAWRLKVGYSVTYTSQRDVTPDPERGRGFAGARLTLDHEHQLTESTVAELAWTFDGNAQELGDVRGDLAQSISAALGSRLSLKTTLQLLWDSEPPLERVPLLAPGGTSSGENVLVPLRKLDHNLSLALVVTL